MRRLIKPLAAMDIEKGNTILKVLEKRCGENTNVHLSDGKVLLVTDIAWGQDIGDDFAHVTTNVSPPQNELPVDFFYTNEVVKIVDTETEMVIINVSTTGS